MTDDDEVMDGDAVDTPLAQILLIASLLVRTIAVPILLLCFLLSAIGAQTLTESSERSLASIMAVGLLVILMMVFASFFKAALRGPAAFAAALAMLLCAAIALDWLR